MGGVLQALGCWLLPDRLILVSIIVFVVVAAISYGFELFSKITGLGYHEVMDAIATIIGGILGMGIATALLTILS